MTKKIFALATLVALLCFGTASATTEAANYQRIGASSTVQSIPATTTQVAQTAQVKSLQPVATMSVEEAANQFGSLANYNTVMNIPVSSQMVVTIDRFHGQVSLYSLDDIDDYAQFMAKYVASGHIVAISDVRSITGIDEGVRVIKNAFLRAGVSGEFISYSAILENAMTNNEVSACQKVLKSSSFFAFTVHIDYARLERNTAPVVNVAPATQKQSASERLNDTVNTASTLINLYTQITGKTLY